jgi:hypothetical protein
MQKSIYREFRVLAILGILTLATPLTVQAESGSSERWNQGQAELQKDLPPGMPADFYKKKLGDLGYQVTSTNYNKPDYLEYEIVKGDQTWEVQINVNEDTHKATSVEIAQNLWKTDETKAALEHNSASARSDTATSTKEGANASASRHQTALRNNQYSDRDRASTDQLIHEVEALPLGHDKQYYKDALHKQGFDITRIDKDDTDELKLEAVKNGNSVKMDVDFNENTGRSTKIDASSLWAESESTSRTRKAQDADMDRRSQADMHR